MKKAIFVVIAFLLVAAALIPAYADVSTRTWLGTAYTGVDKYYDQSTTVYAYQEGTTAVVAVTVTNSNATSTKGFNVTSVYMSFDWGSTYTSTQVSAANPLQIAIGSSRVFFINFTVPNTTTASNRYIHSYTIYATYKMANSSNYLLSGTYSHFYDDFVVYSTDQAAAMDLLRIITSFSAPTWTSAQAQILSNMALNETSSGNAYYAEGNFTRAKESYTTALDDLNTALSDEQSYESMQQDLQTQTTQAQIASMNAYASFLNGFSTLWVLLGIGWVLLGIGYIIKWLRTKRPEAPAAPVAPA